MTLPLAGTRVLDLTRLLPGSVCTMMLADLGADVVKIEDPNGGDYARWFPPLVGDHSVFFHMNNRNKRSVILNLKEEAGQAVLKKLVESADVLVEGFRPGVLDRLGCGYEALKAVNPRLIFCSLSGWGKDGPYVDRSGHDLNYVAIGGLSAAMPNPQVMGGQIADMGGAYIGVSGILAALLRRERTDTGSYVEASLFESALPFVMYAWVEALSSGATNMRTLTGGAACYNVYTSSDGKALTLAALEPKFWSNFATAVGRPDLLDGNYMEPERQPALIAGLRELFATKTAAEWDALLTPADCCFAVAVDTGRLAEEPHIKAREMLGVDADGVPWMRSPVRISGLPLKREPVPGYGEHTRAVLAEAGYSEADINALAAAGVIRG